MTLVSPLQAYGVDVGRVKGRTVIGDHDAAWLVAAHALWRMAEATAVPFGVWEESEFVQTAGDEDAPPGDGFAAARRIARCAATRDGERLLVEVRPMATAMEDAGALSLAKLLHSTARRLARGASPHARGLSLVLEARVTRQLGDFEAAADLYSTAGQLGKRTREPEIVARAELGQGIIARIKGNYPDARARFGRVVRIADRRGITDLIAMGHQGLMIVASVAHDTDAALLHGWQAFIHSVDDSTRQAELLLNLGVVAGESGHDTAALASFLRAAERAPVDRIRLAAWAQAAVSAARLGKRDVMAWCTGAVEHALSTTGLSFERAQILRSLAEAWTTAGVPTVAQRFLRKGLELARANGFHEIEYQLEALAQHAEARPSVAPPVDLKPQARKVLDALRELPATSEYAHAGA